MSFIFVGAGKLRLHLFRKKLNRNHTTFFPVQVALDMVHKLLFEQIKFVM